MYAARSSRRCEATSASAGASRRVRANSFDIRMVVQDTSRPETSAGYRTERGQEGGARARAEGICHREQRLAGQELGVVGKQQRAAAGGDGERGSGAKRHF